MVVPPVENVNSLNDAPEEVALVVIGCGNPNRCDDGVGVQVAAELLQYVTAHGLDQVRVCDAGTGGMEVMFMARGARELVIIDACVGAGPPGAVFRVPGTELEAEFEAGYTLHDFRWNHALAAGRKMFGDRFPERVTVYLVEAGNLDFGLELSPEVQAGAHSVRDLIRERIDVVGERPSGA